MVHHKGRPDLFRKGKTKYTASELLEILQDESTPVFVYVDENANILGHGFCIREHITGHNMHEHDTLYIDDICVDETARGKHVGKALYDYVHDYALSIGCYNITLNVWEGNEPAICFYRNMGMQVQKTTMETIL